MRPKFIAALALAALAAASPFTGSALATADQTFGMAIMSASVNSDGTHANQIGGGVVASAYDSSAKEYTVKFNRPIADCVSTASAGSSGVIASTRVYSYSDTLEVYLASHDGTPVKDGFQLIVFCAR